MAYGFQTAVLVPTSFGVRFAHHATRPRAPSTSMLDSVHIKLSQMWLLPFIFIFMVGCHYIGPGGEARYEPMINSPNVVYDEYGLAYFVKNDGTKQIVPDQGRKIEEVRQKKKEEEKKKWDKENEDTPWIFKLFGL